ncbi:glycosyltransferase [Rubrivirga sp.]|uniref:glycosyltransferase n=1 Tax=Rubrivirga sp. TaxID=1885344 RepID=UPI003C761E36
MKRVLIVSPRFAPSNAADSHRVRQSLPYYREAGWEPVVLAVKPDEVAAPQDPILLRTVPDDVEVVRVGAIPRLWTERAGVGSLEARAIVSLMRAGRRLLRERPFDLVFFSTTAMAVTALGPRWKRETGVPFIVDFQDPWVSDYYARTGASPPGGAFKFGLVQAAARRLEPHVLRSASHAFSVSPAYPRDLAARYPWLSEDRFTVLPFGAPERDFDVLRDARVSNPVFDPSDGLEHWAYVGRAGEDMAPALDALFNALAAARQDDPGRYDNLRLHFVGTSYAEGDRATCTVAPVAERHGVADLVEERPHRIPYFEALQVLLDADAVVIPGSDDPGYTASKLYPYVLARRPLLAVFHEASTVIDVVRETRAGTVVPFASAEPTSAVADRIRSVWFDRPLAAPETDWKAFEPYTARTMAHRQANVFHSAIGVAPRRTHPV